jgi:DHA2 family multidrug resistance protein-like MFS transporter
MLTLSIGIGMTVLDSASANIALPTIARDLGVSAGESVWVVNAYQLAVVMTLLPLAALGDIIGYRPVFRARVVVFLVASVAVALSTSLPMLTIFRIIEGMGASGTMAVNLALVRQTYPRAMLGRGIGMTALVVAVSSAIGPTVASAVLAVTTWRALFVICLPLGICVFFMSMRVLPYSAPSRRRFDILSAFLSAAMFGGLITGIDGIGHGQSKILIAAELLGALLVGIILVLRQRNAESPILPVDLFRRPMFALTVLTAICSFAAQACAFVALPFLLLEVFGRTQVEVGMLMTPWPASVAVMAIVAGRLADHYPASVLAGIGLATMTVGLTLIVFLPPNPHAFDIIWRLGLSGIGFGFFQTPNNRALVSSTPPERSGVVGGVQSTARLLGQTLGAAAVAMIFGVGGGFGLPATTLAVAVGACFAAAGAMASCTRLLDPGGLPPPPRQS